MNHLSTNPHSSSPLLNHKRFSADGNEMGSSGVRGLLAFCCPSAILWAVVSVVVYSINGVAVAGPRSHISIKVLERVQPAFADDNPASAVIGVALVTRIDAPSFHVRPRLVLTGFVHSVTNDSREIDLQCQASTAKTLVHSQRVAADFSLGSARAPAEPSNRAVLGPPGHRNYGPPRERHAGQVFAALPLSNTLSLSHANLLNRLVWLEPRGVISTVSGSFLFAADIRRTNPTWLFLETPRYIPAYPGGHLSSCVRAMVDPFCTDRIRRGQGHCRYPKNGTFCSIHPCLNYSRFIGA